MRHSFASKEQAKRGGMATGYRHWFGFPIAFDAPFFRANLPAGFITSLAEDLGHYLAMYLR
jgi:putative ATP-binding cassette transporter